MAKKTNHSLDNKDIDNDQKSGWFQNLILWVFIPLLALSAIVLIITKATDINVFDAANDWSKSLPFIGEKSKNDNENAEDNLVIKERVVTLQAEIQEKEAQLYKLQQELDQSAEQNEKLLIEQEKYLDQIAVLQREKDDSRRKFQDIVTTFEQMSAKASAPVITNMSDAEAIRILTSLKSDTLAAVLEKMSPEDAAKYTTMMTN